jgi:protein-tyrosine-phosphatase
MSDTPPKRIIFVCQHGAFRSRLAAAFFNSARPAGWEAISAGLTPQSEVSTRLTPLLAGTDAERFGDLSNPRRLSRREGERVIAIDAQLDDAELWTTEASTDEGLRDEIQLRVARLIDEVSGPSAV